MAVRIPTRTHSFTPVNLYEVTGEIDVTMYDNSPVRLASKEGHIEIVKYLCGIPETNPSAVNNSALKQAFMNKHVEIVKFLCDIIISPDKKTRVLNLLSIFGPEITSMVLYQALQDKEH